MNFNSLMYGNPSEVADELCSQNDPEKVLHVELIAALGHALNRIAKLETELFDTKAAAKHAANVASCLANGITPD